MWIYSSPAAIGATAVATFLGLLWLATGRSPFAVLWRALRYLVAEHRALALVAVAYSLLAFNLLQSRLEAWLSPTITWDFTQSIAQVGTGLLQAIQRLEWAPLTHLFTFVYVVLFTTMMAGAMVIYLAKRDLVALKNHVVGFWVNYLVALPFYFWFPVDEAWAAGRGIRFFIPQLFPAYEQVMRPHSGLDNCFPSLHTSLALTYALVAWRQGYRRLAIVLSIGAGLIMLSTLYLGVHWILDMVAGSILAVVASGYLTAPVSANQRELQTDAS